MGTRLPPNTPLPADHPLNHGALVFSVNRKRPTKKPSETSKKDEPDGPTSKGEKPKGEEQS